MQLNNGYFIKFSSLPFTTTLILRYNNSMDAKSKKNLIISACVCGGLIVLLSLLMWVRTLSPSFSEFVCRYISRPWVFIIGHITSLLPFSVFEFSAIAVIIAAIVLFSLMIRAAIRKRGWAILKGLTTVIICIMSVFNFYTLTVGFSYYRPAAPVPQSETDYAPEQVTEIVRYFANDYNELSTKFKRDSYGNVVSPYTLNELSEIIGKEYSRLDSDYYYGYTPKAKGLINSWFLTLNNISGITFVPLGEPTVNRDIPPSDIPQTMAHEMAHAQGVMREGEANFVAYYLLLSSNNDYLRYCGYFSCFGALLPAVNANTSKKTEYEEIRKSLNPNILTEQSNSFKFWRDKSKQPGFAGWLNRTFEKIGDFFNDIFLKSNGAANGNDSYNDKITDGSVSDTGQTNPDTGEIIYEVTYSSVQKMYFALYEKRKSD